jgi:hypothetical protein
MSEFFASSLRASDRARPARMTLNDLSAPTRAVGDVVPRPRQATRAALARATRRPSLCRSGSRTCRDTGSPKFSS